MSKPLAVNQYAQNASGIFVPVVQSVGTSGSTNLANLPTELINLWDGFSSSNVWRSMGSDALGSGSVAAVGMGVHNGSSYDRMRTPNIFKKIQAVSVTAGTPVAVWTPAGGKKFRMMGYTLATTVAASILFEDATGGANEFWRTPLLPAASSIDSPPGIVNGYLSVLANNALFIDVTVTGIVSGVIYGTEE